MLGSDHALKIYDCDLRMSICVFNYLYIILESCFSFYNISVYISLSKRNKFVTLLKKFESYLFKVYLHIYKLNLFMNSFRLAAYLNNFITSLSTAFVP